MRTAARFVGLSVLLVLLVLLTACDRFPRDPQGTLDGVQSGGVLHVGLIEAPPWVLQASAEQPEGVEVRLLEGFAQELGVQVQWHHAGMEELFRGLKELEIHVVAGGLTTDNPWKSQATFTLPFYLISEERRWRDKEHKHVMAVTRGENAFLMRLERYLLEGPAVAMLTDVELGGRLP